MGKLGIIIPTYNRADILLRTVTLIRRHILSPIPYAIYVGCDGNDDTPARLERAGIADVILSKPSGSLGANLNRLIKAAREDGCNYLWQQDDDHQPVKDIDIRPHIALMDADKSVGWVRMMGIAAHRYVADLVESYWHVRWESPELYIPSNRPHVKRADWVDVFGWYAEGVKLWQTEEGYCHQCRNIANEDSAVPCVAVPLTYDESAWDHVGHSLQEQGL